jgi:hypothetical protein
MGNTLTVNNVLKNRHLSLILGLGTLGSATLVLSFMFFARGKDILFAYTLIIIATGVVLKTTQVRQYMHRFWIGLGAFMMSNLSLYLYILLAENRLALWGIPIWAHTWRLGLILAIGVALNLAVARITE